MVKKTTLQIIQSMQDYTFRHQSSLTLTLPTFSGEASKDLLKCLNIEGLIENTHIHAQMVLRTKVNFKYYV